MHIPTLQRLVNERANVVVNVCNGEPHPDALSNDKDRCSAEWQKRDDELTEKIESLAAELDWKTSWPGAYPCFSYNGKTVTI